MANEHDIMTELVDLGLGRGRGESLDLSDRDDLDPPTMVELRSLLTRYRNAIDVVSRSLAEDWYRRYGESGYVDPETGQVGYVSLRSSGYQIEDPDGFAEWLRTLSNEEMVKVIGDIRVSPIPDPVRKTVLSQKIGTPTINLTNTDNPKAPKWVTRAEGGSLVQR